MIPAFLLAASLLIGQFKAVVVVNGQQTSYGQDQNEDVVIGLPTNKYQCVRRAVEQDGHKATVMISCSQGKDPVFTLGAQCSMTEPESTEAMVALNVGTAKRPENVILVVACKTTIDTKKGTML